MTDCRATYRWRKLRLVVLERDRRICYRCGGPANSVDHIVALADGGAEFDLRNLRAACGPCNSATSPGGRPGWVRGQGVERRTTYADAQVAQRLPGMAASQVVIGRAYPSRVVRSEVVPLSGYYGRRTGIN